ncbi:MAG: carboxypeptidase-like regulatory domain-containing protein, partial [Candidatus Acidiferrales bacterium]
MSKQLVFSRSRFLFKARNLALILPIVIFFAAVSVSAQTSSVILGTVKDASGASVAGASVTVLNVETGLARSTMSGEDGAYRIPALQAGHYSVKVEKEGFKTSTQTGITVDVAQELNLPVNLEVGSSAQEVVVTGEAPQIDTSTSTLGGLVNDEKVAELPLNGRNYIDLSLMQTGVTKNYNTGQAGNMIGTTFSANGAPIISNNFLLDGTSIVNPSGWGPGSMAGTTLGVDGVKEYKVITSAFSAEYGMTMGSQMVLVSKGGSNQFHGDAFEYLRNNVMDARNFFDYGYLDTGKRDPLYQRNNFGGAFGGPIRKDKTFFFVVYEGVRQNQGVTVLDTMPSQSCLNAAATGTVTSTQCSLIPAGTGGTVTTVHVNSISAPLLQLFPSSGANLSVSGLSGNF